MDIPRLEQKVASFLFKRTFEGQAARLKEDIDLATIAINDTTKNVKFAKILELILALGNWLNYGTYAGNCFGFTLESLEKLRGTKSPTKPEISILHYLVWFVTEKRQRLLDFPSELEFISKGSSEHLQSIASELTEINLGYDMMNQELEALKAAGAGASDPFIAKMDGFAKKAKSQVDELNKAFENLNNFNAAMYTQFAAEKGICVITLIDQFCKQFTQCKLENQQREEAQINKTKKKKRKKIKKKKISTSSKTKGLMKTPTLSEGGEELAKDTGPDDQEDREKVLEKLFPGSKEEGELTADKRNEEDEEEGAPGGEVKAKKVKKVKKIKKVKKVKKKKGGISDEDEGGGDDDAADKDE